MIVFYNIVQVAVLLLLWPLILLVVVGRAKYRARMPARLGLGLDRYLAQLPAGRPRIWIHVLSLGEARSALSLVRALRQRYPGATLLFSCTTTAGERFVRSLADFPIDRLIPFPLDLYPVTRRFIGAIRPDLFVLVETDFWPNLLHGLQRAAIPAVLVNGRISEGSYTRYRRLRPLFLPLFASFRVLALQRRLDMERMAELGVKRQRLRVLGNLKYDAVLPTAVRPFAREDFAIGSHRLVWIAGSTHPGEEEIVCAVFQRLRHAFPALFLIIAPRAVERADEVERLVRRHDLAVSRRSSGMEADNQVMVLDTMGELAGLYAIADIAFVGGSMVAEGGHNPLEPAVFGVPVFFGVHMEDFADVVEEMMAEGCAEEVGDAEELAEKIAPLLADEVLRKEWGTTARTFVTARQGVNDRYLDLIGEALS
ncbi:MAG: 3-deoxy-D-manno-octulosonic acid transferase [Thermodesulfobacteriota bacterium]